MDKEELKEKAVAALNVGVAVAKKLGNAACELGKEGVAAAKAKVQEVCEERSAQKLKKTEESVDCGLPLAGIAGFGVGNNDNPPHVVNAMTSSCGMVGEPPDVKFIIRGWLYFIYWIVNVLDTIGFIFCLSTLGTKSGYYYGSKLPDWPVIFVIIGVYLFMLLMNRLCYEISIAIFEMVKHLRQIRDELRSIR